MESKFVFGSEMETGDQVKTGVPLLEKLINIGSGIVTLRSINKEFMNFLLSNLLVRNVPKDRKILYLHCVDYHTRYWTLNLDFLLQTAKQTSADTNTVLNNIVCLRAFSRDTVETWQNWKRVISQAKNIKLAVLDSVSELYEAQPHSLSGRGKVYLIGRFKELCQRNNCIGIILDYSDKPIEPYLAEVSSIIITMDVWDHMMNVHLTKHPLMATESYTIRRNYQPNLGRWIHAPQTT